MSAKTRAEAYAKFKELQRLVDDGLPPSDRNATVASLFERWGSDVLAHQVSEAASSNYLSVARNHIVPTLGRKRLVDVTTADVDRLIAAKMRTGLSVSSVQRIRSVFAQALDQGIRWGWVTRNVATLARAPRSTRRDGRTLTPDQAKTFLAALEGHRFQALYTLMLCTGLRRGEALGLMWTDFDESRGILNVRRQLKRESTGLVLADTKTARSRRSVNLPEPMITLLKQHRATQDDERDFLGEAWVDSGLIFTSSIGTAMDPRNLLRDFKKVCADAGLGDWHPHELRHSAASLMLAQGVKLQVVSEVLGHASIRMTADVYGHILNPDREEAARAMSSALWG